MEAAIFLALLRNIAEKKAGLSEYLSHGNAKSYEDYCRVVGEFSAYERLEDEIKDLQKRYIAE